MIYRVRVPPPDIGLSHQLEIQVNLVKNFATAVAATTSYALIMGYSYTDEVASTLKTIWYS
jgi:hypothetical protein